MSPSVPLAAALLAPLGGLVLLLAAPSADVRWEHHPSHFWLVTITAGVNVALALATEAVARRRADARLVLVSLAFLSAAAFLGLHALATPRVLLDHPNAGFVFATPVGLVLAALFAAAAAAPLDEGTAQRVVRHERALRYGLLGLCGVWAIVSLADLPPLDSPRPVERASGPLVVPALVAVVAYAGASLSFLRLWTRRRATVLLACAAAFVLLAEAMTAIAFARNWHASWWLWHVLMLVAFAAIAVAVRREPAEERFGDLYLDRTAGGRRRLSVLFADLAGYTAFSEGRDPDEVAEMLNAYFDAAVPPIVRRHGGDIDRVIGDAIMATFNTRGDQPDHARRAALAALDLQRETARLSREHPEWPRFRAGVNTGEARVGMVGPRDGRTYTIIGDTVNTAARLEAAAPVGGVVVSAETLSGLSGARVTPLGDLQVKGRREPVAAYVLEEL